MTMKTIGAVLAAAILFGGGIVLAWQPAPPPPVDATMILANANGQCGKTLTGNDANIPGRIHQNRGGVIRWSVTNGCAAQAAVALGGWNPSSPFGPGGQSTCTAAAGGGRCNLIQTVRQNAAPGSYSYTVSINGVAVDPDIIVEQ